MNISNLSKNFGRKQALEGVSFQLDHRCTALLGPNGAGKTTLIKCIAGLTPIIGGKVILDDLGNDSAGLRVGYLPQSFSFLPNLTVREALNYLGNLSKIAAEALDSEVESVIEQTNLSEYAEVRIKALSGGTARRLGIAQALLGSPNLILLDEPTAGLDIEERVKLKSVLSLAKESNSILISTHQVEDIVDVCERVLVIDNGRLIYDGLLCDLAQPTIEKGYLALLEKARG